MPSAAQLCPTLISYVRDCPPKKIPSEGSVVQGAATAKRIGGPNLLRDVPSLYLIYQNLAVTHVSSGQKCNLVLIALNTYFRIRVAGMVFKGWQKSPLCITPNTARLLLYLGAPILLLRILDDVAQTVDPSSPVAARNSDVLDAFCGQRSVFNAFVESGARAELLDLNIDKDVSTTTGFFKTTQKS